MYQTAIPCLLMRAGTSRGPFFRKEDLPTDIQARDEVLLTAVGSPDPRQIDGLGGGDTLTSKVAIISRSNRPGVDIDYLFAQVSVDEARVDTNPSCGNMLAGVGPAAIEMGLIEASEGTTRLVIFNENTNSRIESVVQTPGGRVQYDGDTKIDGVSGSGAPIFMNFMDVVGSKTGALFPTGAAQDVINGTPVSCVDVAMPMVLIRLSDLGRAADENPAALCADQELMARIERIRREAGARMGLGDVSGMVIPKIALLSEPEHDGHIRSWYLTPHSLHAAHAVTGAVCVASAGAISGTVANEIAINHYNSQDAFVIEHPSGKIAVRLSLENEDETYDVVAGTVRTARLIMRGEVMVPDFGSVPLREDQALQAICA